MQTFGKIMACTLFCKQTVTKIYIIMKQMIPALVLILLFLSNSLIAKEPVQANFETYHKNVYGELMGAHVLGGVNFDMRLNKGRMDGIGFRAGVGGLSISVIDETNADAVSVGLVTFPLEVNHLYGKRRSFFITGLGLLPAYATASVTGASTDFNMVRAEGFGLAGGFLTLGYRFQPLKSGVMFQFNWNPLILRGSGFNGAWFGLGLGFGFK